MWLIFNALNELFVQKMKLYFFIFVYCRVEKKGYICKAF